MLQLRTTTSLSLLTSICANNKERFFDTICLALAVPFGCRFSFNRTFSKPTASELNDVLQKPSSIRVFKGSTTTGEAHSSIERPWVFRYEGHRLQQLGLQEAATGLMLDACRATSLCNAEGCNGIDDLTYGGQGEGKYAFLSSQRF